MRASRAAPRFRHDARGVSRARRIALEVSWRAAYVSAQRIQHRCEGKLAGRKRASGVAQIAELDCIADPVGTAAATANLNEVIRSERVEPFHDGAIGGWVEDGGPLPGRKDRLARHRVRFPLNVT